MRRVPRKAPLIVMAAAFGVIAAGAATLAALKACGYQVIANVTQSAPIGFYWLDMNARGIGRGDYILIEMPKDYAALVYARGYAARGEPLLKRAGAMPGDRVCVTAIPSSFDAEIAVNGTRYGTVFGQDFAGRNLPYSTGCYTVKSGYVVPLNNHIARSFDGRYFGQVPDSYIVGKARTLWTY